MKILRIIARLNVGGPARHVVWLAAGLKAHGYETLLVAGTLPPGEDDMSYLAKAAGVEPFIVRDMSRELSLKDLLTAWKLFRLMVRQQPDIVHTHTAKAGGVGRAAGFMYRWLTPATLVGRPRRCWFVHTYHGHVFHSYYGRRTTRLFLTIEKLLARMTHRIVVVSEQQRREIHEQFGLGQPEQFAVVPLGIDLDIYANWSERRESLRRELNLQTDQFLIGIIGRLTEIKNHKLFLEAAALLKQKASSARIRFIIIGDGTLRNALEVQAAALGLTEDVIFLGTRNDPETFYPALDVVALTSLNEGTPLSLIEGMANERPVIATGVGGVAELLGREVETADAYTLCERGLMVESGDVQGLARGLQKMLEDETLRGELGRRGREYVLRNYAKERLLRDISALYLNLVDSEARQPSRRAI